MDGVYDWIYNGHGNWPFNTAYAATFGYEGYVARLTSLRTAEKFIDDGVPVIMSIAWKKGEFHEVKVCWRNKTSLFVDGRLAGARESGGLVTDALSWQTFDWAKCALVIGPVSYGLVAAPHATRARVQISLPSASTK